MSDSSDYWFDLTLDQEALHNVVDTPNKSLLHTGEHCLGFDNNVGDSWLYPSNLPERTYQLSIVKSSLFNNTLVVLPTGLGKTFIAAVVMYNIYRWYPTSKVIFMAPTRPLVAQQIEACQRVMPFPDEDTVELTGKLHRNSRKEIWKKKRVFFATPQVVLSDMFADDDKCQSDLNFPFKQVKLIVVDEAHRAKGRYAYTEVVRAMKERNNYFRVVALSATPGRTMEDIAEVVQNLLISHIEVRCDTSEDVLPYIHKRNMKTVVVQLGNEIKELYAEILSIIDPYLKDLISANVLRGSLKNISRNFLLFEQKRFREIKQNPQHSNISVSKNFSFCISMYHALELLERHGIRVFLNYFEEDEDGRNKFVVNMEPKVRNLLDRLRHHFGRDSFEILTHPMVNGQIVKMPDNLDFGHPKFEQARTCLLQQFQTTPNTRAIVFCEYRESVMLMYRLLLHHEPLLKPRYFVGQGGGNMGSLRPLTQKQQIKIMDDFRSGKCNILIATSIGEEGIDVGEVELILCFDINSSNPQRFLQRIGRTGRKKQGNVVVLVTEGREQQIFKDVLAQKDLTNGRMLQSMIVNKSLYKNSPRLVPTDVDPNVIRIYIKPTKSKEKNKNLNSENRAKEKLDNQDLRNFFKKKVTPNPNAMFTDPSQHGLETQQNLEKCFRKIDDYFNAFDDPVASNTQLLRGITCTQTFSHKLNSSQRMNLYNSQRFRNLKKVFEKNSPLIPSKELITNPIEQLKSSKVSNDGKLFILRTQPSIVSNIFEKMKLLEILPLKPDEMSDEEKDIRHLYNIIEKLLGGNPLTVEMFIDDADIERVVRQRIHRPTSDYDVSDSEYKDVCNTIFDGLEEQGLLCDNFDYIQEELKKTKFYKDAYPKPENDDSQPISYSPLRNDADSMVYETVILDEEAEISTFGESSINTESMCQDNCQWNEFTINAGNKSTPVQGPLAKAFQRQLSKFGNKIHTKGKSLKLDDNFGTYNSGDKSSDVITLSDTSDEDYQAETQALISRRSTNSEPKYIKPNLNKCSNNCKNVAFTGDLSKQIPSLSNSTQNDLDVDRNNFLKPIPEETREESVDNIPTLQSKIDDSRAFTNRPFYSSNFNLFQTGNKYTSKVNCNLEVLSSNTAITPPEGLAGPAEQYKNSSTLFSPLQIEANDFLNTSTNVKPNLEMQSPIRPITPPERLSTQPEQYQKSPTVYEMFLENVKRRNGNMPEHIKHSVAFAEKQVRKALSLSTTDYRHLISKTNESDNEESKISSFKTSKCKNMSSSDSGELNEKAVESETDCEEFIETQIPQLCTESISNAHSDSSVTNTKAEEESETECEEITETQKAVDCFRLRRQNRHRLDNFIDYEAAASGDESDDEYRVSQYVKDSMIVSSDELDTIDENAPTSSQMQAHYMQSIKSPKPVARGAFKIPPFREYNDLSQIYSQVASIEPSQYVYDSFVVDEEHDKECMKSKNETLSPLERAERILKERQRARNKFKKVGKFKKRKRIHQVSDSSDDDFIFLK
ncbi:DEAD-box ATP-dependent DNA helicase Fancm [Bactrocera oleae]|uniref:DEAD-box ATP-dependent DNA helicase Fancm n=1 Tax=Bactrocera oleae TaxID=104688 RepID=UPI00387EBE15